MKLRIFSDTHWEHSTRRGMQFIPKPLDTDLETILILAGDLYPGLNSIGIIKEFHQRFKEVLIVLGNHDFWGQNYERFPRRYKEALIENKMDNVHLLQNDGIVLDGYTFVGSTFWTNMDNGNPAVETKASWVMQMDFTNIKYKQWFDVDTYMERTYPFTPELWRKEHEYAFEEMRRYVNQDHPTVLITHHPGSMQAIHEDYKKYGDTNYLWASEYGNWVADNPNIKMWISGHTHTLIILK